MRKADYLTLSDTIAKRRDSAIGYRAESLARGLPVAFHDGEIEACEAIARTFSRFASVDKAEFLKACRIAL